MLLERFGDIELLDERPRFRGGVVPRGLRSLPLRCRTAGVRRVSMPPRLVSGRAS